LRFDTELGHITAIELRNGKNHYTEGGEESLVGAGQVLRFSGRVLFSEDSTPAPAGAFDVVIGDYDNSWTTRPQEGGFFSLDFIVPAVRSGHLDLYATMSDMPGYSTDRTSASPRLQLAVDSNQPQIESVRLANIVTGDSAPLNQANSLTISLETSDDYGFDLANPAIFHYVLKAGSSEVSRGSVVLDDALELDETTLWLGGVDITDGGATRVLPTYTLDSWITGSDAAGNPFLANGNTEIEPLGSWTFSWVGPEVELRNESTSVFWDEPSPHAGQTVSLNIFGINQANDQSGELKFVLEENIDGNWVNVGEVVAEVAPSSEFQAIIDYTVSQDTPKSAINFRLLMLDNNIELDRISITPLLITDEVERDWDAVSNQVSDSKLAVVLYIFALLAASYGVWMMVLYRRIVSESEEDELDQTTEVVAEMTDKVAPPIPAGFIPSAIPNPAETLPPPIQSPQPIQQPAQVAQYPPVPETGYPQGWTEEQWKHYGWNWLKAQGKA